MWSIVDKRYTVIEIPMKYHPIGSEYVEKYVL